MPRWLIGLIAVAVAEFFGLMGFAAYNDELSRRVLKLSSQAAFQNAREFERRQGLVPDFDSCLLVDGLQTCTALKENHAVKYHCDDERCNFDCEASK